MRYGHGYSVSTMLQWTRVPGIGIEFVQSLSTEWLSVHDGHMKCILDKATGNSTASKHMVTRALQKIRSILPRRGAKGCIPIIALGVGWPVFPLPTPIPYVFMFMLWPMNLESCNAVTLHDEIDQHVFGKVTKPANTMGLSHGVSLGLFPIPSVSYIMSKAKPLDLSFLLRRTARQPMPDFQSLRSNRTRLLRELDAAIQVSVDECPTIRRRFELHRRQYDFQGDVRAMPEEELRLTAASFPELGGKDSTTSPRFQAGFAVGGFALVGTGGVGMGVFTGPSMQGTSLSSLYKGCASWRRVVELWRANPLLEVGSEEEQALETCLDDVDEPDGL